MLRAPEPLGLCVLSVMQKLKRFNFWLGLDAPRVRCVNYTVWRNVRYVKKHNVQLTLLITSQLGITVL